MHTGSITRCQMIAVRTDPYSPHSVFGIVGRRIATLITAANVRSGYIQIFQVRQVFVVIHDLQQFLKRQTFQPKIPMVTGSITYIAVDVALVHSLLVGLVKRPCPYRIVRAAREEAAGR